MLTKIRVRNFKSLNDTTLDVGQRNVVVGANMAGKSNVIDLFRFMYQSTFPGTVGTWGLVNAINARGGFGELSWKGGNEQVISISLSGAESGDTRKRNWNYEISIQGDKHGNFRVTQEKLQIQRQGAPEITDELIETRGFERYFRNPNGNQLSSMNDASRSMLEFEIPDWEGNFLRSMIKSWRFYELVPPVMVNPNPMGAPPFLTEHGENLSQWLLFLQTRFGDSFSRIQTVLKDALPQVMDLFTSPTSQSTVLLGIHEKHLTRPVTLSQMSAGELAFIAFLSLIFAPPELTGSLYCVEDVENYLHPGLIETLLEVLRQNQEEWEENQAAQIVMTTHSPIVVDKMKLDQIVFVKKKTAPTLFIRPRGNTPLPT